MAESLEIEKSTLSDRSLKRLLNALKNIFFKKTDAVEAETLSIDSTVTANSGNLITSGAVKTYVDDMVGDIESALILLRGGSAS